MKKNLKIVSLAAAALLAVSPVVASGVVNPGSSVVKAAAGDFNISNTGAQTSNGNSTSSQTPTSRPYFTYRGQAINEASNTDPSANVVPTTINIQAGDTITKIADALDKLNIEFYSTNSSTGDKFTTSGNALRSALVKSGVTFNYDSKTVPDYKKDRKHFDAYYTIKSVPTSDFNLTISRSSGNQTAIIQIPFVVSSSSSSTTEADAPVFKYSENNGKYEDLNGHVFQVAVNSNFDPTNFVNSNGEQIHIIAQQNSNNSTIAAIANTSNPVNTSEAGRFYNVTLTATSFTGKTATATYTVLITSSAKQQLYGNGTISTYRIYGNNVLSGSTTFKSGDTVYVADRTRTINNVSYSQVSTKSKSDAATSNIWVKTSDLTKPASSTTTNETSETHRVMVDSKAYDKNGNYLGHDYAYNTNIDIVPTVVNINGKTYYKVAGKDEYVRVTNITGTLRRVRHNAYVYWSSYRRNWTGKIKYYRGQYVHTYGAAMTFRNGKRYYRIDGCSPSNKRYLKVANF